MMKLYVMPGACSLAPHIALHELELDHDIVTINLRKGEGQTPEHLARNPVGAVPVLETEDGRTITEVMAILLYLAQRKPEAGWIPADVIPLYERMSFVATELHKSFFPLFFGERIHSTPEAVAELGKAYKERLAPRWARVSEWLGGQDYLLGTFGPADIYLYVILTWWVRGIKESLDAYPNLVFFMKRMEARRGVLAALEHENLKPVMA
ncbi:MAG: glutathione S-transferase N-terminal domain-containing protein [Candidatus Eremiobacteraeota bacterium]|nr:glutathione S-transferase N-terminal domain-containing protein [Candidatus Eremiobacteraeota bacterium]